MHTQLLNRRQLLFGAAAAGLVGPASGSGQSAVADVAVCLQQSLDDDFFTDTTHDSLNSRMRCIAPASAAIREIVLAYPGFYTRPLEVAFPCSYNVAAAVEYPVGIFTPATVAGRRTLRVNPDQLLCKFDPCQVGIPAGSTFYIKTYATWVAGGFPLISGTACQLPASVWRVDQRPAMHSPIRR